MERLNASQICCDGYVPVPAIIGIFSGIFGCCLLLFALCCCCLWQVKSIRTPAGSVLPSLDSTPKQAPASDHLSSSIVSPLKYHVRSYIGCCPRKKGPVRVLTRQKEMAIHPCWFRLCPCCCQKLATGDRFLDEIIVPTILITPAQNIRQASNHGGIAKMSILAPESIVVPPSPAEARTAEAQHPSETIDHTDFYALQLRGAGSEKIMY